MKRCEDVYEQYTARSAECGAAEQARLQQKGTFSTVSYIRLMLKMEESAGNMKRRVIIFITSFHPFIGGAEIAVQETIKRLSSQFDFFIITARFKRNIARTEKLFGATVWRIGLGTQFDKWLLIFFAPVYAFFLLLFPPSLSEEGEGGGGKSPILTFPLLKEGGRKSTLLWGVDISQGSLAAALVKLAVPRIPFVVTIQYGDGEERLALGRGGMLRNTFRFMLRHADHVTAISNHLAGIARDYGYCGPLAVVPNGVDLQKFQNQGKIPPSPPLEKGGTVRTPPFFKGRLGGISPIIITTSRLVHKNGIDTLIDAMAIVKKKIPDVVCWILGDGPEQAKLLAHAESHGLPYASSIPLPNPPPFFRRGRETVGDSIPQASVKFLGSIPYEKIPEYLHKAHVFVRPSRSEGMGNSFVEAMAAGLPVIGTQVGGIPDIIENEKTGLFCRVDDPEDIAEKIIRVLKDDALRSHLIEVGQRRVRERFEWNTISTSYSHIFSAALAPSKRMLIATPLFPPDIGGPATYAKILADSLPFAGIMPRLVYFGNFRRLPKVMRHAAYFFSLLCNGRHADIILALDPVSTGVPAAIAAIVMRKRFVLKIVGDYAWEQYQQINPPSPPFAKGGEGGFITIEEFQHQKFDSMTELRRKIQQWVAKHAKKIIVPSAYLKSIVQEWGIPEEKITVIYNAFDTLRAQEERNVLRARLGVSGMLVLSVGRLVPWKGFEALIDVMPGVLQRSPDARLFIIGSGPLQTRLRAYIAEKNLVETVILKGNLSHEETLACMKAADIFVLNTGYEGLSHTLLEAMSADIPIVTTGVGGNPELIEHNKSGLMVGYNNKKELMEAIKVLDPQNEEIRRNLVQNARAVVQKFTKERMIKETTDLLASLKE